MCLIFPSGKCLFFIFLCLFIFFSLSPDNESSKCECSAFPPFFVVLMYGVVVCVTDIFCCSRMDFLSCSNLFIGMFRGLLYFTYRAVLSFWTVGRLLFGRFIAYNAKIYIRWFNWKALNGFITNRGVKFSNYWRGMFSFIKFGLSWIELEWCGVDWKWGLNVVVLIENEAPPFESVQTKVAMTATGLDTKLRRSWLRWLL